MMDRLAWHGPRTQLARERFALPVQIMGHRGAAGLAPENTLAAFHVARELGVPFELDVAVCKTGELAVMHDDRLERTTNGRGPVAEATRAELAALDAGTSFDPRFAAQAVPTLNEVFEQIRGSVLVNIEIKTAKPARRAAKAVVDLIRTQGLGAQVIVTSFDPFVLQQVRELDSSILRGQIYGTFEGSGLARYKKFLLRNLLLNRLAQPDLLMVEHTMVSAKYLKRMHRRGYLVFAWTVNDAPQMSSLIDLGVDGIITDRPDIGLGLLK